MKSKYVDYIGMYENVYPDGFCDHMIEEFERLLSSGSCGNRQDDEQIPKTLKEDYNYFLNVGNHEPASFRGNSAMSIFWDGLQRCYDEYSSKFDVLNQSNLRCTSVKMQKSNPGSGYHVWHSEQGNGNSANRGVVYALYLNSLEPDAAGETEFLYQRLRIPPKENCMVLWPAAFTHTHRGNVVHGDKSKYIITGWFYYD
jgi:hypothetical protein